MTERARRVDLRRGWRALKDGVGSRATIHMKGVDFRIPSVGGMRCTITDPWMLDVLELLFAIRKGPLIDVGANLGQTLIKAKAIDPSLRYIGIEPNPACVFYLLELAKENRFDDCSILPIGLSSEDRISTLDLYSDEAACESASLIREFRPAQLIRKHLFVPVFRWPTVAHVLEIDDVSLIKIDVEGAELEVVATLEPFIRRHRPFVLLEVLPAYTRENAPRLERQQKLENLFKEMRYLFYRVKKTADHRFAGLATLSSIGVQSCLTECDYVLVPSEADDRVLAASESRLLPDSP